MNYIKYITSIALTITLALLTSCSSKPSLQQYFVDSQEKNGFVTTTIPKTILGLDVSNMSKDTQQAYHSINKVNVLYYPVNQDNKSTFVTEQEQLNTILQDPTYKTLFTHKSNDMSLRLLYDGSQDQIDEIIVYGSSPDRGLGVARILGDQMNLSEILKMVTELKDTKPDSKALTQIINQLEIGN